MIIFNAFEVKLIFLKITAIFEKSFCYSIDFSAEHNSHQMSNTITNAIRNKHSFHGLNKKK